MRIISVQNLMEKGCEQAEKIIVDSLRDYKGRPLEVNVVKRAIVMANGLAAVPFGNCPALLAESGLRSSQRDEARLNTNLPVANCVQKQGAYLFLNDIWAKGYFHWISEQLPKALLAETAGFKGTYVIPNGGHFIKQSLVALGISEKRMVYPDKNCWAVDELYLPEQHSGFILARHTDLFSLLRKKLFEKAVPQKPWRKIYVQRKQSICRHVVNDNELIDLLHNYQFDVVRFEDLNFIDQVKYAAEAKILLGPIGSGMTNCMFMTKGETLIELFPATYIKSYHTMFISVLNLGYYMMPSKVELFQKYKYGENIHVYLTALSLVIEHCLGHQNNKILSFILNQQHP